MAKAMNTLLLAWQVIRGRRLRTALFAVQFVLALTMSTIAVAYVFQAWWVLRLPQETLGADVMGVYSCAASSEHPDTDESIVAADLPGIKSLPGVRRTGVFYQTRATVNGVPGVPLILINEDYLELTGLRPPGGVAARLAFDGEEATAWITRRLSRRLGVVKGGEMSLRLARQYAIRARVVAELPSLVAPPVFPFPESVEEFSVVDDVVVLPLSAWPDAKYLTNGLWIQARPGQLDSAGEAVKDWWLTTHPDSSSVLEYFSVEAACREAWEAALVVLKGLAPVAGLLLVLTTVGFVGTVMLNVDSRRAELAVRRALGATLSHLTRQLVVESLLVLTPATAIGALLGTAATVLLTPGARAPGAVFASSMALGLIVGGACGLLGAAYPLYRVGRDDPAAVLKRAE